MECYTNFKNVSLSQTRKIPPWSITPGISQTLPARIHRLSKRKAKIINFKMKYLSSNRPNGLIQSGFGGGREEGYIFFWWGGVWVGGRGGRLFLFYLSHFFFLSFSRKKSQSFTARRLPLQPIPFRAAISCVHFLSLSLSFGNFLFLFRPVEIIYLKVNCQHVIYITSDCNDHHNESTTGSRWDDPI
jgi:hypothetical protein